MDIDKLHNVFFKKALELEKSCRQSWRKDFSLMLGRLGIKQIERGDYRNQTMGPNGLEAVSGDCDRLRGCLLIFDPSEACVGNRYLLIPKDLAQKILVLGL